MEPKKVLELARVYREKGKYKESLEMHEWFHFNALKNDPSYVGVRLSFALSDWVKLGQKYPVARDRLFRIRDDEIEKIQGENWNFENFLEVIAISRYLDDIQKAVEVFKIIGKKESDRKKVERCFNAVFKHLVENKEAELCSKYLGDIESKVQTHKKEFQELKNLYKMDDTHNKKSPAQKMYAEQIGLLVRALKLASRSQELKSLCMLGRGILPDQEYEAIFN